MRDSPRYLGGARPAATARPPTLAAEASYGDDEIDGTEEEEAFEGMDNEAPTNQHQAPPFAQAFASMVHHGAVYGANGQSMIPPMPPHNEGWYQPGNYAMQPGPHPAHMSPLPTSSHPQTQSASLSRQPPIVVSGYHHLGQSSASAAPVSPAGMNGSPASSDVSPAPGASTASARSPSGQGPPSQ